MSTITSPQLKNILSNPNLIILDASPASTASGKTSTYPDLAIPGARIVNIKADFCNKHSEYPNTVPRPDHFEEQCRVLGINTDSEIVVYDSYGIYTSPRVWWLFNVMGHDNVKVLDGGLPDWVAEDYETVSRDSIGDTMDMGNFKSHFQDKYVLGYEAILDNIESEEYLIVDARSKGRFHGTAPEPRTYLQSGNIPNSVNIPFTELLDNGRFKSKEELQTILRTEIPQNKTLAFSCGSGLTACIVMLAHEIAYGQSLYLFDGSWTEYAERQNLKIEE